VLLLPDVRRVIEPREIGERFPVLRYVEDVLLDLVEIFEVQR
jgi:hypothetical protein